MDVFLPPRPSSLTHITLRHIQRPLPPIHTRVKSVQKHVDYIDKDAELYGGVGTDNGPRLGGAAAAAGAQQGSAQDMGMLDAL